MIRRGWGMAQTAAFAARAARSGDGRSANVVFDHGSPCLGFPLVDRVTGSGDVTDCQLEVDDLRSQLARAGAEVEKTPRLVALAHRDQQAHFERLPQTRHDLRLPGIVASAPQVGQRDLRARPEMSPAA